MIANPAILELAGDPLAAALAFVQIALGLALVSFGLIACRQRLQQLMLIAAGLLVIFARLIIPG
jgi:hypothetical protein